MKNNFNIDAYLREAEANYSGFDSNYGDMGVDGPAPVAAPAAPLKKPNPYQLQIANTTAGTLTCILFGHNYYLLTSNFGSSTGVTVTPTSSAINYLTVLSQSATQPFDVALMRVRSSSSTQVVQAMNLYTLDANGQQLNIPIYVEDYFSANQYQSGIVDVDYSFRIDGNTYLSFSVLANVTLTITFFPANKVNLTPILNGGQALTQYAAPAVAVAATPVYVKPAPAFTGLGK